MAVESRETPTIYGDTIVWERPVQLAAQFFIKQGDEVLDVGGNTGGVAIAFARMVGPLGKVYSFECNPKMIKWIREDAEANGIKNLEVIPLAVYKSSNEKLNFYLDESFYSSASSLYRMESSSAIIVKTVSIDDLCEKNDVSPSLIKMDIEGGEADAIRGGNRTIDKFRPIVILEFSTSADNPIRLMIDAGYDAYDVNTYRLVDEEYFDQKFSTNVVCVPRERGLEFDLGPSKSVGGGILPVETGYYVATFDLSYSGSGIGELSCIGPDKQIIAYFQAEFSQLQHHSCSTIPFATSSGGTVTCEVRSLSETGEIAIAGSSMRELRLTR